MPEQYNKPYQSYPVKDGPTYFALVTHNASPFATISFLDFLNDTQRAIRNARSIRSILVIPIPKNEPGLSEHMNLLLHYDWDTTPKNTLQLAHVFPRVLTGVLNQPGKEFAVEPQVKWQSHSLPSQPNTVRIFRDAGSSGRDEGIDLFPFADTSCTKPEHKKTIETAMPAVLRLLNQFETGAFRRNPPEEIPDRPLQKHGPHHPGPRSGL